MQLAEFLVELGRADGQWMGDGTLRMGGRIIGNVVAYGRTKRDALRMVLEGLTLHPRLGTRTRRPKRRRRG